MKISNRFLIPAVCAFLALCVAAAIAQQRMEKSGEILIYKDGKLVQKVDMSEIEDSKTIDLGTNKILAEPDGVSVISANCPDKLCVRRGKIHSSSLPIICLPNRVEVRISGKSEVDAVVGQ